MSKHLVDLALARPGDLIGYRKNGQPIYLIGGAAETDPTNTQQAQAGFQQGVSDAPTYTPTTVTVPVPTPPPSAAPPAQGAGRFFTEEDIARARQEEKDKLYSDLSSVKSQLKTLQDERDQKIAEAQAEAQRQAEEAEAARQANLDAKSFAEEEIARVRAEAAALREQYEQDKLIAQKELEFQRLQSFIQQRALQEQDNIAPELIDMISGNNEQEVEQSIAILKEKSAQIAQSAAAVYQGQRAGMRGVSVTGYSASDPMDTNPGHKTYSLEELAAMPAGSPEYRELRKQLNIGRSQSNVGLLG